MRCDLHHLSTKLHYDLALLCFLVAFTLNSLVIPSPARQAAIVAQLCSAISYCMVVAVDTNAGTQNLVQPCKIPGGVGTLGKSTN